MKISYKKIKFNINRIKYNNFLKNKFKKTKNNCINHQQKINNLKINSNSKIEIH